MKLALLISLMSLSAEPSRADEAAPLPPEQGHEVRPAPQLMHLERALSQKQEAREKGTLPPENYQVFVAQFRAELDAVMGRITPTPENKGLHAQILARLGEQDRGRAVASLDQALVEDPENPALLVSKGSILHEQKDYPAAAALAQQAWEASGRTDKRAWALLKMSEGRIAGGKTGEPAPRLQPAADFARLEWSIPENNDINPKAMGFIQRAITARRKGDMPATRTNAQSAMNADPTSAAVQKLYGIVQADQSKHVDTLAFVGQAVDSMHAGRGTEALAWAQKAYDRSPSDDTYGILQDVRRRSGELDVKRAADSPAKAPAPKGSSPLLPIMIIAGTGFMVAGGYKIAKSKGTRTADDGINPAPYVSPEQARRNYVNSAVLIGTPIVVAGLVFGGPIIWRAAAPAVGAALRGGQESVRRLATSEAGAINPQSGGTVWNYIKPTQPDWPGTEIPKSFEVSVRVGRLWVHPNATEHMSEYLAPARSAQNLVYRPPVQSQVLLDSFRSALDRATAQGIQYGKPTNVGQWEFVINRRASDALPVVMHAEYKH